MKSISLPAYNKNIIRAMLGLKTIETKMPTPNDNEVIIKVNAAPINPSDIAFIQGVYNVVKPLPATPGFEASGVIVDAGKNCKDVIGKKVSCFVQDDKSGTWSEFVLANKEDIILLKDEMDMDQAACFTVNPFTAYGLFSIALIYQSKAIVQNASGGQVAYFIRKMAEEHNIKVIDIVRKPETATELINDGAKYVLVETDENFKEKLHKLITELDATVAFDAVGGTLSGIIYNALPNDSELVVYGGLSGKAIDGINTMEVIFNNKIISGFNLIDWKAELDEGEFEQISEELQEKFICGDYKTKIADAYSLEDIVVGLRSYISAMSLGKILIKP